MNVEEKLKKLFLEKYNIVITSENEDTYLDLLGIDSLELVNLIIYIEETFDFDFYSKNIDLIKLKTFTRIKNTLEENENN